MATNNRQGHYTDSNNNANKSSYSQRYTNRAYATRGNSSSQGQRNVQPRNYHGGFNKNITSSRPEQAESLQNAVMKKQAPQSENGRSNPAKPIDKEAHVSKKVAKQNKGKKPTRKASKPKMKLKLPKGGVKAILRQTNRKIAIIACSAVLVGGLGTWALVGRDRSKTMVCESTVDYNKGIGYTFYLGRNGKSIDTIEKNDTVSLKFIKKNLGEENAQQILDEYKKKTTDTYNQTVEKYKKYSFFSSEIKETDSQIVVNYRIRVADENFSYQKYKDILEDFGMVYFYDSDTDSFTYNEDKFLSEDIPLGSIEDVSCRESKKKLKIKKASSKKLGSSKTSVSKDGGSNG